MTFSEFHTIDYILLGALLLLFLVQMYFYIRYMAAPSRKLRRDSKSPLTNHKSEIINQKSEITEGVSVLLSAHNESYNLSQYLQALLSQDYPTFEVIVIDDRGVFRHQSIRVKEIRAIAVNVAYKDVASIFAYFLLHPVTHPPRCAIGEGKAQHILEIYALLFGTNDAL